MEKRLVRISDSASQYGVKTVETTKPLVIVNSRITYKNAPIHLLEKFTFKDMHFAHQSFLKNAGYEECVILQTCNRVEVFVASAEPDEEQLHDQWAKMAGLSSKEFSEFIEVSRGKDAIFHLLRLASGLDSLLLGEDQILGQTKRAFEFSRKYDYAGSHLSVIFDRAVKIGGRVRMATGINRGSVSVGSMAVNLAEEYFDSLVGRKIMLIGSGEGASLVAKALKRRRVDFMITSRTFERAKSFADTVAGNPILFEAALEMFNIIDIIFVATTAPYYLVTHDRIENAMINREGVMMIFDLSNPRTVEDKVANIPNVKLINIDQIGEIVEKNVRSRMGEIQSAEKIIDGEIKSVDKIIKKMQIEPAIVSIFKTVDSIRNRELKKALAKLDKKIGPAESRIIEQLSHAIVDGIVSTPMNNLRMEIQTNDEVRDSLMKAVAKLFDYEEKQKEQQ